MPRNKTEKWNARVQQVCTVGNVAQQTTPIIQLTTQCTRVCKNKCQLPIIGIWVHMLEKWQGGYNE